ncbi:energy-coupled thiamine transporter ThiT [Aerococcus suis]
MKSSQRLVIIIEGLLFIALALLIQTVFPDVITGHEVILRIGFVLLLLYGFRRGPVPGFIASGIFGLLNAWLILPEPLNSGMNLLWVTLISLTLGIASLFARNLQRTLHNHRMKSVYLNLVTGTFLSTGAYFGLRHIVNQWVVSEPVSHFQTGWAAFGLDFGINFATILIILILLLNVQAKSFIPKHTPYISRKERSRLLND